MTTFYEDCTTKSTIVNCDLFNNEWFINVAKEFSETGKNILYRSGYKIYKSELFIEFGSLLEGLPSVSVDTKNNKVYFKSPDR